MGTSYQNQQYRSADPGTDVVPQKCLYSTSGGTGAFRGHLHRAAVRLPQLVAGQEWLLLCLWFPERRQPSSHRDCDRSYHCCDIRPALCRGKQHSGIIVDDRTLIACRTTIGGGNPSSSAAEAPSGSSCTASGITSRNSTSRASFQPSFSSAIVSWRVRCTDFSQGRSASLRHMHLFGVYMGKSSI